MSEPASERAAPPNLGQLLEDTLHHGKDLLQAELSLARAEISRDVSSVFGSLGLLAVGAMFLQAALTTLGVVLVFAFGVGVVAIALLVLFTSIGSLLLLGGLRGLERKKLPRTTARLALDVERVMETVK
jgi:Putative Actinobacterial Holin-X, holin superfamily III